MKHKKPDDIDTADLFTQENQIYVDDQYATWFRGQVPEEDEQCPECGTKTDVLHERNKGTWRLVERCPECGYTHKERTSLSHLKSA